MMNEPTNRAITANTIRNVVKNDSPCWIWSCDSLVAASPVMASVWAGSRARMASTTSVCETPGAACTRMTDT